MLYLVQLRDSLLEGRLELKVKVIQGGMSKHCNDLDPALCTIQGPNRHIRSDPDDLSCPILGIRTDAAAGKEFAHGCFSDLRT